MKKSNVLYYSLFLSFFLFFCDSSKADQAGRKGFKDDKKGKNKKEEPASTAIQVRQKWDLPLILKEISGLVYLDENRFACVQDESGVIFIYNTATAKIEKQVPFGAAGDYEGLALVGNTAYVVRSDGKLFEVAHFHSDQPKVQTFTTSLTAANNVEGLTHDAKGNRLLLAIKGAETGQQDFKGIYAFDLKTKKLGKEPVVRLNLADPALPQSKKPDRALQPSEIAVHPATGEIYLTEAANPQLLVLQPDGSIKTRYKLSKNSFGQPEGMSFTPAGKLYISNEGGKGKGNILEVAIR
ncbi:MAG: SdiA-regulated domain-containing protein [Adhaeribacter sp.]